MGALPFCSTRYSSGERVRPEMRTSSSLLTTGNFFTETVKPESAWTGIENQTTKDVQRPLVTAQDWIQSPRMVQGRCGEVCMPRCIPMFSGQGQCSLLGRGIHCPGPGRSEAPWGYFSKSLFSPEYQAHVFNCTLDTPKLSIAKIKFTV